jgi:CheY-like chemotaxis protein
MAASTPSVLIVDDEFSLVETLHEILSWEGYAVVSAPNGRAALDQMATATPSLVLLDFMMPVMDGLAMLREMRQTPAYARLPVILMSAAGLSPQADGRQYDALLRKPFEARVLLELVRNLLAR